MNEIISAISTLGFPIVACIGMGWYVKYQTDSNNQEVSDMRKEHKQEIDKVTKALNDNTLVIQKLCDKLDKIKCVENSDDGK